MAQRPHRSALLGTSPAATPLSSPAKPWLDLAKSGQPLQPKLGLVAAAVERWRIYSRKRSTFRKELSAQIDQRVRKDLRLALYVWHAVVVTAHAAAAQLDSARQQGEQVKLSKLSRGDVQLPTAQPGSQPESELESESESGPQPEQNLRSEPQQQPDTQPETAASVPGPKVSVGLVTPRRGTSPPNAAEIQVHLSQVALRLQQQQREWREAEEAEQAKVAIRRLGERLEAAKLGAAKATAACEAAAQRVCQAELGELAAKQHCEALEHAQVKLRREVHEWQHAEERARRQAAKSAANLRQQHGRQVVAATAWKRTYKLMRAVWQALVFATDASLASKAEQQRKALAAARELSIRNDMRALAAQEAQRTAMALADARAFRDTWAEAALLRLVARKVRANTRHVLVQWARVAACRSFTSRLLASHQRKHMHAHIVRAMRGWMRATAEAHRQAEVCKQYSAQRMMFVAQIERMRDRQTLHTAMAEWSMAVKESTVVRDELNAAISMHEAEMLEEQKHHNAEKHAFRETILDIVLTRRRNTSARHAMQDSVRVWQIYSGRKTRQQRLLRKARRRRLRAVVASWHREVKMQYLYLRRKALADRVCYARHKCVQQKVVHGWQRHMRRCQAASKAGRMMRIQELLYRQQDNACVFVRTVREKKLLRSALAAWREQFSLVQTTRRLRLKLRRHLASITFVHWRVQVSRLKVCAAAVTRQASRHSYAQLCSCFRTWSKDYRAALRLSSMKLRTASRTKRQVFQCWRWCHVIGMHHATNVRAAHSLAEMKSRAVDRLTRRVKINRLGNAIALWRRKMIVSRRVAALHARHSAASCPRLLRKCCKFWKRKVAQSRRCNLFTQRVQLRVIHRALVDWASSIGVARYRDAVLSVHAALDRQKYELLTTSADQAVNRHWRRRLVVVLEEWAYWSSTRGAWTRKVVRALGMHEVRSLTRALDCWKRILQNSVRIQRCRAVRAQQMMANAISAWKLHRSSALAAARASRLQERIAVLAQRRVFYAWHSAAVTENYTNTLLSHMRAAQMVEVALDHEHGRAVRFAERLCNRFVNTRTARFIEYIFNRWRQGSVATSRKYTCVLVWSVTRAAATQGVLRSWVRWQRVVIAKTHANHKKLGTGWKLTMASQRNRLEKLQETHASVVETSEAHAAALLSAESEVLRLQERCKQRAGLESDLANLQIEQQQTEKQWAQTAQTAQMQHQKYVHKAFEDKAVLLSQIESLRELQQRSQASHTEQSIVHLEQVGAIRATEMSAKQEAYSAIQSAQLAEDRATVAADALVSMEGALRRAQRQLDDCKMDQLAATTAHDAKSRADATELQRVKGMLEAAQQSCESERGARKAAETKIVEAQLEAHAASQRQAGLQAECSKCAIDAEGAVANLQQELVVAQQEGAAAVRVWTQRHADLLARSEVNMDELQAAKSQISVGEAELARVVAELSQAEARLGEESRRCELADANIAAQVQSTEVPCTTAADAERAKKTPTEEQLVALKRTSAASLEMAQNELITSVEAERQQKNTIANLQQELVVAQQEGAAAVRVWTQRHADLLARSEVNMDELQAECSKCAIDAEGAVANLQQELVVAQQEGAAAVRVWTQRHADLLARSEVNMDELQAAKSQISVGEAELARVVAELSQAEARLGEESRRCELADANIAAQVQSTEEVHDVLMIALEEKQQLQLNLKELLRHPQWQGRAERLELKQQLHEAQQHARRAELVGAGAVEAAERTRMLCISMLAQQRLGKQEKQKETGNSSIHNPTNTTTHLAPTNDEETQEQQEIAERGENEEHGTIKPRPRPNTQPEQEPKSDTQMGKLDLGGNGLNGLQAVREKLRSAEAALRDLRADVNSNSRNSPLAPANESVHCQPAGAAVEVVIGEDMDIAMCLDEMDGVFHTEAFGDIDVVYSDATHRQEPSMAMSIELRASDAVDRLRSDNFKEESEDEHEYSSEEQDEDKLLILLNQIRPVPSICSHENTRTAKLVPKDDAAAESKAPLSQNKRHPFWRQKQHPGDDGLQKLAATKNKMKETNAQHQVCLERQRFQSRRVAMVDDLSVEPPPMFFVPTMRSGGRSFRNTETSELTSRAERKAKQLAMRSTLSVRSRPFDMQYKREQRLLRATMMRWAIIVADQLNAAYAADTNSQWRCS